MPKVWYDKVHMDYCPACGKSLIAPISTVLKGPILQCISCGTKYPYPPDGKVTTIIIEGDKNEAHPAH